MSDSMRRWVGGLHGGQLVIVWFLLLLAAVGVGGGAFLAWVDLASGEREAVNNAPHPLIVIDSVVLDSPLRFDRLPAGQQTAIRKRIEELDSGSAIHPVFARLRAKYLGELAPNPQDALTARLALGSDPGGLIAEYQSRRSHYLEEYLRQDQHLMPLSAETDSEREDYVHRVLQRRLHSSPGDPFDAALAQRIAQDEYPDSVRAYNLRITEAYDRVHAFWLMSFT